MPATPAHASGWMASHSPGGRFSCGTLLPRCLTCHALLSIYVIWYAMPFGCPRGGSMSSLFHDMRLQVLVEATQHGQWSGSKAGLHFAAVTGSSSERWAASSLTSCRCAQVALLPAGAGERALGVGRAGAAGEHRGRLARVHRHAGAARHPRPRVPGARMRTLHANLGAHGHPHERPPCHTQTYAQ